MGILAGFLTVVLVLNCLLLILLVLIQLPKKEAGVGGAAFGTGATDVLFGAGSGNALTKITKFSAALFMGISLVLSVVNTARASRDGRSVTEQLQKRQGAAESPTPTNPVAPALNLLLNTNAPAGTNVSPATNPPAATAAPGAPNAPAPN